MKKVGMVLFAIMMLAGFAQAQDKAEHERDLRAIGNLVDARLVAAIASTEQDRVCPDFNFSRPELVKEYLTKVIDEKGRLENGWRVNINTQAMMLNQQILGIIGLEKEGVNPAGRMEIYYRSGAIRQISIYSSGKVVCGMSLEQDIRK